MLLKWPRRRLNGNIWIGKDQMVRLLRENDLKTRSRLKWYNLKTWTLSPFTPFIIISIFRKRKTLTLSWNPTSALRRSGQRWLQEIPTNRNQSISSSCVYSVHFQIYVNYIARVLDNFRMRKKMIESTVMAATFAVDNIKHLAHNVTRNAEHDWVNRLWSLCSSIQCSQISYWSPHLTKPNPLQACWSSCLPLRGFALCPTILPWLCAIKQIYLPSII